MGAEILILTEGLKQIKESIRIIEEEKTARKQIDAQMRVALKQIEETGKTVRVLVEENTKESIETKKTLSELCKEAIKYGDRETINNVLNQIGNRTTEYSAIQRENLRAIAGNGVERIGRGD